MERGLEDDSSKEGIERTGKQDELKLKTAF